MIKYYGCGSDFLAENKAILDGYPLETVFFEANANLINETDDNEFLVKVQADGRFLLAVHHADYPMVIFGDVGLCAEFAKSAAERKLTFSKVLGALDTCEAFLAEYEKLANCTREINHAMDIMQCDMALTDNVDGVESATESDVDELASFMADFYREAVGEEHEIEQVKADVMKKLSSFAVIRQEGKIASMAATKRETERLACISDVYTLPQYRDKGLSCKVVTYLTKRILGSGKLAYLFVDKTNPISNHLYRKIGYKYAVPQYEIKIKGKK